MTLVLFFERHYLVAYTNFRGPLNFKYIILAAGVIAIVGSLPAAGEYIRLARLDAPSDQEKTPTGPPAPTRQGRTLAGNYLSSLFAQRHHDWQKAGEYLNDVMRAAPVEESSFLKRAMALAMGAGDPETAFRLAKKIENNPEEGPLARLFLMAQSYHNKQYKEAGVYTQTLKKEGGFSNFIMPLLDAWAQAANGVLAIENLNKNSIHVHHAALIADFLGKPDAVLPTIDKLATSRDISLEDVDRLANLYAHLKQPEKAKVLLAKIIQKAPDDKETLAKIEALNAGRAFEGFIPVKSPEEGVAASLYDMANLLFREYSDDSARIFAQMSVYLAPHITDGRLLLAALDARNERYEQAIYSYKMIPPGNKYYLKAQRRAADLMEESGDIEGAIAHLEMLARNENDLDSLIKIGDIYRHQEDFPKAIEIYNRAAAKMGSKIPADYWALLYARGMSYERAGDWEKAEADLKTALDYQPDHSYLQNYLGYAWADKGINLDQALGLIKKAAETQPDDGYITDSLGWIYFRLGRYSESLPHLEKAVELLPYDPVVNDHLGDAYWRTGRKREARFQWQRAKNFSSDASFSARIETKISDGLTAEPVMKEASSQAEKASATP